MFTYITRKSVWDNFDRIFDNFDNVWENFDTVFKDFSKVYPSFPPTNIYLEKDKTLIFEFAVAGYPDEAIDVNFSGDTMILSLEPKIEPSTDDSKKFLKRGIKHSKCNAQYLIPSDKYKIDEAIATINNGLLRVEIPAKEPAETRKVEIKKV
ncbi:MAG TPA: Hsp20/alpha crystallin family protein [Candidatus Paceibacterota bacterium]|nr:Hsp20/alpha crystallin family protein [Candidatus Paceibacterota bacterium]